MHQIKIAILDMYKGEPNQGMRNIHEILDSYAANKKIDVHYKVFDVRGKHEVPDISYDAYIGTGGPGSPIDKEGWEMKWVMMMNSILHHNANNENKKLVFLICHSYQVMCHHFNIGIVCLRKRESFGIFPIHKTHESNTNQFMSQLHDPFYAVDSRKYQVVEDENFNNNKLNAKIMAMEKIRDHVPLQRAIMALQFTPEIFGTQFHPEADALGMIYYLEGEEKKELVIKNYGIHRYHSMLNHLNDPDKIMLTQLIFLPTFLDDVLGHTLVQQSNI